MRPVWFYMNLSGRGRAVELTKWKKLRRFVSCIILAHTSALNAIPWRKTRVGRLLFPAACANTVVPSGEVINLSAIATVALKTAVMFSKVEAEGPQSYGQRQSTFYLSCHVLAPPLDVHREREFDGAEWERLRIGQFCVSIATYKDLQTILLTRFAATLQHSAARNFPLVRLSPPRWTARLTIAQHLA